MPVTEICDEFFQRSLYTLALPYGKIDERGIWMKILVIEVDKKIAKFIARGLEQAKYEVALSSTPISHLT